MIDHPKNITYDQDENGNLFVVMEFCEMQKQQGFRN